MIENLKFILRIIFIGMLFTALFVGFVYQPTSDERKRELFDKGYNKNQVDSVMNAEDKKMLYYYLLLT